MSADEMFEKIGYKKNNEDCDYIEYNHKNERGETWTISFSGISKTIMCALYIKGLFSSRALAITSDELKAINKKVEELGW